MAVSCRAARTGTATPGVCGFVSAALAAALTGWLLAAIAAPAGEGAISSARERAAVRALQGTWVAMVGGSRVEMRFRPDGAAVVDGRSGTYTLQGRTLKIAADGSETSYVLELGREEMTLSGGDLEAPLKFTRQPEASDVIRSLVRLSPSELRPRFWRVLTVAAIVLISRLIILVLQQVSRLVVVSERGPLRLFYRRNKNRALTVPSVVLNLAKYVIYFTALGYVLGEFGVNYTAYLASLSVIGLAVGFGSQGLVQDMVTGFFIVFEGQFDVGDMVEISGQTGLVQELGLRMTKLRNYAGATVVIPNRNIAMVGNFGGGAQQVHLDVAVTAEADAGELGRIMLSVAEETARQFEGVVLRVPKLLGTVELATGERFLRVATGIWPGQQWVVEAQMVPRIREAMAAQGASLPGDRIAVFYRGPDVIPVPSPVSPSREHGT